VSLAALALLLSLAATGGAEDWFVDVASERGMAFHHRDGRSGERYYIETSGAGAGWIDYDADGDMDLYLINGAATRGSRLDVTPRNVLYENRDGALVDVTESAGVGDERFGMGMCAGDYDGDGRLDFLVTNYGKDRLYRNEGGGRFVDRAEQAGVADARWGTSCAFADLDGDGDLDLYVAHYVNFSYDFNPDCRSPTTRLRSYCHPSAFDGLVDSLYINHGDGTFREEGERRGIIQEPRDEKGFGVVASDLDVDGDIDVYVANDTTPNRLYVNDGNGSFEDWSLLAGTGLSFDGLPESGMGVDVGDVDGDGLPDLIVTNYARETNTLYRNAGDLMFADDTVALGLAEASYVSLGWGIQFLDYDNDGDLDLAVANGHVIENEEMLAGESYAQPNQLFENDGTGRFEDVSSRAGAAWSVARVSRSLAAGDLNDDGRVDIVITNANDMAELLENRIENANHWLGIELQGFPGNPYGVGARVQLQVAERRLAREVRSGGSFMAQPDMRLHFGLGSFDSEVSVEIVWPNGRRQREKTAELDRYWRIDYRVER